MLVTSGDLFPFKLDMYNMYNMWDESLVWLHVWGCKDSDMHNVNTQVQAERDASYMRSAQSRVASPKTNTDWLFWHTLLPGGFQRFVSVPV